MDPERIRWALLQVLGVSSRAGHADRHRDPDAIELDEVVDFLVHECLSSNIQLPNDPASSTDRHGRTLEDLCSHPLTGLLEPHLGDLLQMPHDRVPLVVDELLDTYHKGPKHEDDNDTVNDTTRECELCDRPTLLTEHHLIPRSEHALFVKREIFTIDECRGRLAMLCRPCHSAVHRAKCTRELASEYNTTEKLLQIPEIVRFAQWNSKRKVLRAATSTRRKR